MEAFKVFAMVVALGFAASAAGHEGDGGAALGGTIGFATLGRLSYRFDVYTVTLPEADGNGEFRETRVTRGESVSYNAQLVEGERGSAILEKLVGKVQDEEFEGIELLVYVSEVEGSAQLYLETPVQGEASN